MYEKDRGKEDQEHTTKATYLRDTIWSNNQHIVRFFYERTDFLMERIPPEKKSQKRHFYYYVCMFLICLKKKQFVVNIILYTYTICPTMAWNTLYMTSKRLLWPRTMNLKQKRSCKTCVRWYFLRDRILLVIFLALFFLIVFWFIQL